MVEHIESETSSYRLCAGLQPLIRQDIWGDRVRRLRFVEDVATLNRNSNLPSMAARRRGTFGV